MRVSFSLMKILLYQTDACSLCDEAFDLILAMPELSGHILETIDIATDDVLFTQFEKSIPVVEIANEQLAWPFSSDDINSLIQRISSHCRE